MTPAEMGRKGGKARMAKLSKKQRITLARQAGHASAKARRAKAKALSSPDLLGVFMGAWKHHLDKPSTKR